ncbi:glycosyltransferase [Fulvimarina sp. 2208YS6-2-32]|uniref:Glycosyltransferase n=1 Tax=Fulvimarina uroteuthidis TaxID=3098149 RepID=A0ABU5I228_9HYPH|nr:glycosyltransferase [Fulvimarina sp. 2208YS6-2-32]MDY8108879.1 glycosyltransferase [Fulvimarina sp. 2208YS6-2-32]
MKVLHFFKTYQPDNFGGVERTIASIAGATRDLGIETTVLSLSRTPETASLDIDGHRAIKARLDLELASTGFSRDVFAKFAREARTADLVHYHFPWPFMDLVHFASRHGKPSLVTYHSDIVKQKTLRRVYAPLMNRFLDHVDLIVATSPPYLATSPVLKRFADKTRIVAIGLDERSYPVPDEETRARWRRRLPGPFFLFTGVLRYYKGLDVLIRAAGQTRADIVIVGTGPIEPELKRQAAALGADNLHFVGPVEDIDKMALHALSAGFVFPSNQRSEAFGLALLEAAMVGKPMISTELGTGTSYVNADRKTGIVVPPNDPDALAAAMNEMIADESQAARWGMAAQQRFEELFTVDRMGRAYAELYRSLVK